MTDLCTFEELESKMPKKIKCPECGREMSIEMIQLGNVKHPTHELEYHCDWLDCMTAVTLVANATFKPTSANVTTGNHGFQEMYSVPLDRIVPINDGKVAAMSVSKGGK